MLINLKDNHKRDIYLLFSQPVQVLQDFCRLALEFLKKGPNQKVYSSASQKLGVDVDVIRLAVEGLVQLLVECHKNTLSEKDFRDLMLAVGFGEEHQAVLLEFHNSNKIELEEALSTLSPSLSHYKDLDWRFDIQVSSRALHRQITPLITMKLTLEDRPSVESTKHNESILLQTDPNNLKHIVQKLEQALLEGSSQHSRRMQRTLR